MFKNYLTITLRILWREKIYGLINIVGLSVGVACCVVIALYLNNELSYDKHHEKRDQIFRIAEAQYRSGSFYENSQNVGALIGPYMKRDYPEVSEYVRFSPFRAFFRVDEQALYETDVQYADNSVFEIFTHQIVAGDKETALTNPRSIAISESFADRHFGDVSPIGEIISTDAEDFTVTLVFADLPQTSHLWYDALVSMDPFLERFEPNLTANSTHTYLMMSEGYAAESFRELWLEFEENYMENQRGQGYLGDQLFLEPLADIYLSSDVNSGRSANLFSLYAFTTVGILVMLIACINYMNLATARSLKRLKEVTVRKILGANKSQLITQLLGESLIFAFISVLLGLGLVELVLSFDSIHLIIGQELSLSVLTAPSLLIGTILSVLLLGLIAGSYPAFYVATDMSFGSAKRRNPTNTRGLSLRNILVAVQFAISIAVIASTLLMYSQMQYMQDRSLGFTKENRINIRLRGAEAIETSALYFSELEQNGQILSSSIVATLSEPGTLSIQEWPIGMPGTPFDQWREANRIYVDDKFFELMDIEIVQGRNFNTEISTDLTEGALINETAMQEMGWDDPLGMSIGIGRTPATIIGVIRDYHVRGLHQRISPTVISYNNMNFAGLSDSQRKSQTRVAIVNVAGDSVSEFLATLADEWRSIDPVHPLEFQFIDEQIDQLYFSEQRQLQLFSIFSSICIFISCLGLLGLAAFNTQQRIKEIGIRRVLGASVMNVILMLFKTTSLLLMGSALVASAISYWASSQWLERFYYQTEISPSIFLLATGITMAIAFITVSSQAYRTATENPVEALRYE